MPPPIPFVGQHVTHHENGTSPPSEPCVIEALAGDGTTADLRIDSDQRLEEAVPIKNKQNPQPRFYTLGA